MAKMDWNYRGTLKVSDMCLVRLAAGLASSGSTQLTACPVQFYYKDIDEPESELKGYKRVSSRWLDHMKWDE